MDHDPEANLLVAHEQLAVTYDGRPKSVLIDRMDWARSRKQGRGQPVVTGSP